MNNKQKHHAAFEYVAGLLGQIKENRACIDHYQRSIQDLICENTKMSDHLNHYKSILIKIGRFRLSRSNDTRNIEINKKEIANKAVQTDDYLLPLCQCGQTAAQFSKDQTRNVKSNINCAPSHLMDTFDHNSMFTCLLKERNGFITQKQTNKTIDEKLSERKQIKCNNYKHLNSKFMKSLNFRNSNIQQNSLTDQSGDSIDNKDSAYKFEEEVEHPTPLLLIPNCKILLKERASKKDEESKQKSFEYYLTPSLKENKNSQSKSNSSSRYNRKTPSIVNFNVYDSKSSGLTNSQEQESQESQLKQAAVQVIDKSANNTRCRTKDSKAGFLHSTAEDNRRSKIKLSKRYDRYCHTDGDVIIEESSSNEASPNKWHTLMR